MQKGLQIYMNTKSKIKPEDLSTLENLDLENDTLATQKELNEQMEALRWQNMDHIERNMKMKERWSWILGVYLVIFTICMFRTLWLSKLPESSLNFLITAGFAKVVVVVFVIVKHLFPTK